MKICHIASPVGWLELETNGEALTKLSFLEERPLSPLPASHPLLRLACEELERYFAGSLQSFTVPLAPAGTPFRLAVWEAMKQIPYGRTATYGELAKAIGAPSSARAVGGACHCNPIAVILPCHRVIGASGFVTGYAGGAWRKQILLEMEARGALPAVRPDSHPLE